MELQYLFDNASRIMTVVSFATFSGILAWTFLRKERDFAQAAGLPFADDPGNEAGDDVGEDYV